MQRINRELNTTGKKINNIGARIINENIYESDVTSIQNLIDDVIDLQNKLDKNIEQYFNKKDE